MPIEPLHTFFVLYVYSRKLQPNWEILSGS